jgi:glutathione S-transferase
VRRAVRPGLQELTARRLRAGRTVPILQLDGRAIGDSSKIIEELERRWPDPPLYPADPEERRRALELEDYFDERCGPAVRRVLFDDNLTEPEKFVGMFVGPDHPRLRFLAALTRVLEPVIRSRYEVRPDRVAHSREVVRDALETIEAESGPGGYLVGDSFTVADLTAASIVGLVVVPSEFPYVKLEPDERAGQFREYRASLKDSFGFRWVESMYARHRGSSAAVVSGRHGA